MDKKIFDTITTLKIFKNRNDSKLDEFMNMNPIERMEYIFDFSQQIKVNPTEQNLDRIGELNVINKLLTDIGEILRCHHIAN